MGSAEGADSIWVSNRPAKRLLELLPHPAAVRFAQSDAEVHSAVYKNLNFEALRDRRIWA